MTAELRDPQADRQTDRQEVWPGDCASRTSQHRHLPVPCVLHVYSTSLTFPYITRKARSPVILNEVSGSQGDDYDYGCLLA